ncbi:MAG: AAA family ATPase [Novosphingobium sp.]|uniref:AAA family ATPase n=1 Tax=Novosphingobium sp. TaxID=1874826 RepID=UPI001D27E7BE|nr:AAA family ATPase [Novosphingobium sp.]MCB2058279.1 AAA family ATPase [Novosphingobium sp.]MCP5385433.1 AAA family ATPase [Novosphingobium sp.]
MLNNDAAADDGQLHAPSSLFEDADAQPEDDTPPVSPELFRRKYQPRTFSELIGQDQIATQLRDYVKNAETGHLLLAGPSGCGKSTTALILAKALNCEGGVSGEACNACRSCRAMDVPDGHDAYIKLNGASSQAHKAELEYLFREHLAFRPLDGPRPVVFIDEAHELSRNARDFLLMVLTDAQDVTVVLAMIDDSHLPPQFVNRFSRMALTPPSMLHRLQHVKRICDGEGIAADPAALELIAERSCDFRHAEVHLACIMRELGQRDLDLAVVRDTLIRPQSKPYVDYLTALANGNLQDQINAVARASDSPAVRMDKILRLLLHLKTAYVGPTLLLPEREAALAFDPATCREIVDHLAGIAHSFSLSLAELVDHLLEHWSFQPHRVTEEVAKAAVVRCHDLLATARDDRAAPVLPSESAFASSRGLRKPRIRQRLASIANTGTHLTGQQAYDIYEAATFLIQEHGLYFNARLLIRFSALGISDEKQAASAFTDFCRNLAQRLKEWGSPLHRIALLERTPEGIHGRLVFHLPEPLRQQAHDWWKVYLTDRLHGAATLEDACDAAGRNETQPKRRTVQHWTLVRELWAGVDPSLTIDGVPLIDRLGVPRQLQRPAGRIEGRRRHNFSQSIGQSGQDHARDAMMPHVSAIAEGAWDQIATGWEFLEHRERQAERNRRQDIVSTLEERLACTGDPLARTALNQQFQAERRSWAVDARHRLRQRVSWINSTPAPNPCQE